MKKYIQRLIRRIWLWAFKDQITGIGLDHHIHSNSWAVLSIQNKDQDYVTFIELNDPDIRAVQQFLKQFDSANINIDRNPHINKELFL